MALHITDDTMTLKIDDRVVATARFTKHDAANENGAWIVSTHPARSLAAGIATTVGANLAHGLGHGAVGVLVSARPAVALVGSFELLMLLIRSAHQPRLERICEGVADLPVPRQSVPPAGAFLEQTVRAWHTADHSQQAIARELSIDRRKAPRAHEAERRPATAPQMA